MAITYERKKQRQRNILYTVVTTVLICAVFFAMVASFYIKAESDAKEMLHLQTKQIKDDITLQLKSDRENLVTMANFASKLYSYGENYDLLFDSLMAKDGFDLNGKISFEEEAAKGEYISGRVADLTGGGTGRTLHPDNMAAGPASYGMTDTMGRMHSDAQFAGSSSVPAHVEMMGLIGMGNTPMVGATVACAVDVEEASK